MKDEGKGGNRRSYRERVWTGVVKVWEILAEPV